MKTRAGYCACPDLLKADERCTLAEWLRHALVATQEPVYFFAGPMSANHSPRNACKKIYRA